MISGFVLIAAAVLAQAPLQPAIQPAKPPLPPAQVAAMWPWRPFLDPMPQEWFDHWWLFVIPLSVLVAVIYKAVRIYDFTPARYARGVATMSLQILLGLAGLAAASFLLVEVYVRWMRG